MFNVWKIRMLLWIFTDHINLSSKWKYTKLYLKYTVHVRCFNYAVKFTRAEFISPTHQTCMKSLQYQSSPTIQFKCFYCPTLLQRASHTCKQHRVDSNSQKGSSQRQTCSAFYLLGQPEITLRVVSKILVVPKPDKKLGGGAWSDVHFWRWRWSLPLWS